METVGQWKVFEKTLPGTAAEGRFTRSGSTRTVRGFQSGEGQVTVRFLPEEQGVWDYELISGTMRESGSFECIPAGPDDHGPVRVQGMGFCRADGKRFLPFGTTCYGWIHQPENIRRQTLDSLKHSPFNKVRMCLFPKWMIYNESEPERFPFEKDEAGNWDMARPDFAFWDGLEARIRALDALGIVADLILFHPYDKWGFAALSREDSLAYLDYCVRRLSAFPNIWWSLANEYDLLPGKTAEDWDAFAACIRLLDGVGHPLSIHNFGLPHPDRDWMTHCSIQTDYCRRTLTWGWQYRKPIVIDECGYEGDIAFQWGNLSGFELVHRIWTAVCCGGYCTHGETFWREDEVLWWGKGGTLRGESAERIAFLRQLLESLPGTPAPAVGGMPDDPNGNTETNPFGKVILAMPEVMQGQFIADMIPMTCGGEGWQLTYLGRACPGWLDVHCPGAGEWTAEIIDVWTMQRIPAGTLAGDGQVKLPRREGQAVLLRKSGQEALQ